ncbi:MAG TPA: adenylate cyclase regulatory domain-containing protein [Solirubrobacterales bacterium]|nr:adenylate cyclase regulatory domain-containing protein [Solirubrobacterales bacterium]HVY96363.1 adenylate cyclase regulatory domain-containing protein [Solirubrobacterales bacterium]
MAHGTDIDFAAAGLLDDLEGEAREGRLELLRQLSGEGVSLEELREAVAAGHLPLLPVERALAGDGKRYSAREVAELSGIDLDLLRRFRAALGVPYGDDLDARVANEADLQAAIRTKAIIDAGLPPEGILQSARTIGMGMARVAEANRELVVRNLADPSGNERDLANGLVATAMALLPLVGESLNYAFQVNLLEQVKRDVIGAADLASGEIGGAVERTVCFADLVEFTSLGEEIAPEELGVVVGHFEELATSTVVAPVRLVKTIGDAVMLVSPEAQPLVEQTLDLVAAAAAEGDQFPVLRAGVATGPTLPQGGDYYGRSVNLASRITGIARPGSVLVDAATRDAAGEAGFTYSFAGDRRLKGIDNRQKLFRVRREGARREVLGRADE